MQGVLRMFSNEDAEESKGADPPIGGAAKSLELAEVPRTGADLGDVNLTVSGATAHQMVSSLNAELARQHKLVIPTVPSLRHIVKFREDKPFDVHQLPADLQRIYAVLKTTNGEDYALQVVFLVRTAVELHRAWHMTLLTSKILEQIKDQFDLRITWNLGVLKLKFRIGDGEYVLNRKVPYDYDSEFQDMYMKIAVALIHGHINVHKALTFQIETKQGKHTATSGRFLRDFPGRLVVYPLEAATCTVIFFGGDWMDAAIAALCGVVAGLIEWGLGETGEVGKVCLDVLVGTSTGVIGGLFYRHMGQSHCLSAIFLGVLYWFFYGTAFVIGLLEIIAGELETGVTRFIAVSVKTFVLCLGAGFGMMLTLQSSAETWTEQADHCGNVDLDSKWWRIPLYLLCSASALAQYRFPIVDYWRGLVVQLVAYEVQYQLLLFFEEIHDRDNLDYAMANTVAAASAAIVACILSSGIDAVRRPYYARVLHRNADKGSGCGACLYAFMAQCVRLGDCLRLGRKSDLIKVNMASKLERRLEELKVGDKTDIELEEDEEEVLVETLVGAQSLNIWAILMPAAYQLVPGAMIAKLWFNSLFPPPVEDADQANVFSNLMVISTSLALGLILGFAIVKACVAIVEALFYALTKRGRGIDAKARSMDGKSLSEEEVQEMEWRKQSKKHDRDMFLGMFTAEQKSYDPEDHLTKV